VSAF
jgi:WD repeat-containing protein 48